MTRRRGDVELIEGDLLLEDLADSLHGAALRDPLQLERVDDDAGVEDDGVAVDA